MKNKELQFIYRGLSKLRELKGVKFCYAVNKNKKILQAELENIEESASPTDKFQEFNTALKEAFRKYAIKDKNGEMKVFDEGGEQINRIEEGKLDEYRAEVNALKEEYSEEVEAREAQMKEYGELLESDVADSFTLHKVKEEYVPEDITCEQMEVVMYFLDDSEG